MANLHPEDRGRPARVRAHAIGAHLRSRTEEAGARRLVWDAWLKVKKNGGAAGVDGVTIDRFGERLKDKLYKLWNRVSSGS